MSWFMLGSLAGGVGLFLLGMRLMTDGLKLAASHTLRDLLARWTSNPARGMLAGLTITSLVQSSSAVTVATIGFVNAGLINLAQAITVIYGSNVGTTMTGWLVSLVGFRFAIAPFALPLIGVGMLMRLLGGHRRYAYVGESLAGFGIFFLGIDVLKTTFGGVGEAFQFELLATVTPLTLLLSVGAGFLLTLLMQSSSAAMAITLTATAGGVIPLNAAAAVVIGTNIGTTSTAALAALGATPNARRAAAAHVIFNLITGAVALGLLPVLLAFIDVLRQSLGMYAEPIVILALFHTTFNVLGVALLFPFTARLVAYLQARFSSTEEDEARPHYLDRTLLGTPGLAVSALASELARAGAIARRMAKAAISSEAAPSAKLESDNRVLAELINAIGEFSNHLQRTHLPPELDDALPDALRVSRYHAETAELALGVEHINTRLRVITETRLATAVAEFRSSIIKIIDATDVESGQFSLRACIADMEQAQRNYQTLKSRLLRAGTEGTLPVRQLVEQLDQLSDIRRIGEQVVKAATYLDSLRGRVEPDTSRAPVDATPTMPR